MKAADRRRAGVVRFNSIHEDSGPTDAGLYSRVAAMSNNCYTWTGVTSDGEVPPQVTGTRTITGRVRTRKYWATLPVEYKQVLSHITGRVQASIEPHYR